MKRTGFMLLAMLFILASAACQSADSETKVLEIKSETLGVSEVKHTNDITETVRTFTDAEKVSDEREITFAGKKMKLRYTDSYDYLLGGVRADRYAVKHSAGENSYVMLLPDGTPYAILGEPVCVLDIKPDDDTEAVKAKIVEKLGAYIDFSAYQYCDVYDFSTDEEQKRFEGASFMWTNKEGDILLNNFTKVSVKEDGTISTIWLKGNAPNKYSEVTAETIPKDVNSLIRKKLESIYSTGSCRLKDFTIRSATLTTYSGKLCIHYSVDVDYVNSAQQDDGEVCALLVLCD